ncbi:hypothetical protein [Rhodoferax sp.]
MVELFNAGHEVTVFDSFCDIRDQAVLTAALRASGPRRRSILRA